MEAVVDDSLPDLRDRVDSQVIDVGAELDAAADGLLHEQVRNNFCGLVFLYDAVQNGYDLLQPSRRAASALTTQGGSLRMYTMERAVQIITFATLLLYGPGLRAQEASVDWAAVADCFTEEVQSNERCSSKAPSFVSLLGIRRDQATRMRALDELEQLATTSSDQRVRRKAILRIAVTGLSTRADPIDTADRLQRLYWSGALDPRQKLIIVKYARGSVNRRTAAQFLGRVASETPLDTHFGLMVASSALNGLATMGEPGDAVLRTLEDQVAPENPIGKHLRRLTGQEGQGLRR